MTLWYCETVNPMGRWTPETRADRPESRLQGGHLRENRIGGIGRRIRNICAVPPELAHLSPMELRAILAPDGSQIAVTQPVEPHQRGAS